MDESRCCPRRRDPPRPVGLFPDPGPLGETAGTPHRELCRETRTETEGCGCKQARRACPRPGHRVALARGEQVRYRHRGPDPRSEERRVGKGGGVRLGAWYG